MALRALVVARRADLVLGATLGGVVAALLGRDAVFLLNALSFVASAALIWRMCFAEPHAEGGHPFRARELVDFSPILAGIRFERASVPWLVGLYITAAYWFTSSTSFANPAVAIARSLTNTFSGIRPVDLPGFIAAELCGAVVSLLLMSWLLRGRGEGVPTVKEAHL